MSENKIKKRRLEPDRNEVQNIFSQHKLDLSPSASSQLTALPLTPLTFDVFPSQEAFCPFHYLPVQQWTEKWAMKPT